MSTSHFIDYAGSRLHYHRFGHGNQWLFCFHGYGETGEKFLFLKKSLSATHTIIAIDLPFHGHSSWQGPFLLEPTAIMNIIEQLAPPNIQIQLLGYSMGGRVCLRLLELYPQQIRSLVLLAPDGLHKNPWQKLATQTRWGNALFRFTMQYPGWMFVLMWMATKTGLFNKSINKFAHHYLDDAEERRLLYRRWTTMRKFRPVMHRLKKIVATYQVPVHLLFGKYDRVIVSKHGYRLQKGLEKYITIQELEAGHHLLQEKYMTYLTDCLLPEYQSGK